MTTSRVLTCTVALALGGCGDHLPGDVLGTYRVTMRLDENTCGNAALPFPNGTKYAVELRADGERGYWHLADTPPFEGRYMAGHFAFTHGQALELGSPDAGTSGCIVLREELLSAEIVTSEDSASTEGDAGAAAPSDGGKRLTGEHKVSFRADPSGRCKDERGPLRDFERLPCSARYHLEGTPRSQF